MVPWPHEDPAQTRRLDPDPQGPTPESFLAEIRRIINSGTARHRARSPSGGSPCIRIIPSFSRIHHALEPYEVPVNTDPRISSRTSDLDPPPISSGLRRTRKPIAESGWASTGESSSLPLIASMRSLQALRGRDGRGFLRSTTSLTLLIRSFSLQRGTLPFATGRGRYFDAQEILFRLRGANPVVSATPESIPGPSRRWWIWALPWCIFEPFVESSLCGDSLRPVPGPGGFVPANGHALWALSPEGPISCFRRRG